MTSSATDLPTASARQLIASLTDAFTELPPRATAALRPDGPVGWQGYDAARARAAERTGETESVVCGVADVGGVQAVLVVFEFGFLGGSIGQAAGERVTTAFTTARDLSLPVVSVIASGGSRLQEGMHGVTQLHRVAQQQERLRAAGLPHLAVLVGPVTGGAWITLGAGADVRLALPGAQVGFAGARTRPPGAAPDAYTAEAQHAVGLVDRIVPREELAGAVARWLALLAGPAGRNGRQAASPEPAPPPRALGEASLPATGLEAVRRARAAGRADAEAYLQAYFTLREPLASGDPGLLCGFGHHEGRTVGYVAQRGVPTRPAGFRAATRLLRLADRLSVPVLTLVDTPGAAAGDDAERDGVGAAIAETVAAVAACRIPVTTLLVGEGGSGGAAALISPGRTWVSPDSYFSVVAPEAALSLLGRRPEELAATADQLRLRPQDLVELGLARGVVTP